MINNLYIADFLDKLCRNRYDENGIDLAEQALHNLRSIVSADDYGKIVFLNHAVRSFESMMDGEKVDLEAPEVQERISQYKKAIESDFLHPENKIARYDVLLQFLSYNQAGNSQYFDVLQKKLDHIAAGDDHKLENCYKEAFFFGQNVNRTKYLKVMHDIYTKAQNKKKFREAASKLGLVFDPVKNKPITERKLTPDQRHKRLHVILDLIKNQLPLEQETNLMEEALTLAHANNLSRSENFELKRSLCQRLQQNYYAMNNPQAGNKKGLEYGKWDRALTQAMVRGHERHDTY